MRHDLRPEMETDTGHVNTAFSPSTSLALSTRRLLEAAKLPTQDTDTACSCEDNSWSNMFHKSAWSPSHPV